MKSVGYLRLIEEFSLPVCDLMARAFMTDRSMTSSVTQDGVVSRVFPRKRMTLEDEWQGHLLFAVKNEGVNLEVLKALFARVQEADLAELVSRHPTGATGRRIWFLYEYLMERKLPLGDVQQGGYVPLVDESVQVACPTSASIRVRRQRIVNNLLGDRSFSPLVRKTEFVKKYTSEKLKAISDDLLARYPAELLYRAVNYLYVKETRSSFAIERETPDQKRMSAFVDLLRTMRDATLTKTALSDVQNRIVDTRYAQRDWRIDQVYVGETVTPDYEKIHFVAVQPKDLPDIMDGFLRTLERLTKSGMDAVVLAAVMSFAFVFIHPFDDGNGRLHRYLMHAILTRTGFTPAGGLIFPISAVLMKKPVVYDRMLESFSRRLMRCLAYDVDANGEVSVRGESADFYRYVDYTFIVEEFQRLIVETIRTEWRQELDYLVDYDRMRREMRGIVDLPEKKANQFIRFVTGNGGRLSKAKRPLFAELTDEEVSELERIVGGVKCLA